MSVFFQIEIDYLGGQKLGRLATIGADGAPLVTPVGFRYNAATDSIDIGGHGLLASKKWRDVVAEPRVAFIVDDVLPPWRPRGVEIRGRAEQIIGPGLAFGPGYDDALIRIAPARIRSFGLEGDRPRPQSRSRRAVETEADST